MSIQEIVNIETLGLIILFMMLSRKCDCRAKPYVVDQAKYVNCYVRLGSNFYVDLSTSLNDFQCQSRLESQKLKSFQSIYRTLSMGQKASDKMNSTINRSKMIKVIKTHGKYKKIMLKR